MLTTSVKTPLALAQSRSGPAGPHLDEFIGWLEERGYQHRRIPHLIRGVKRFSSWAQDAELPREQLDAKALQAFRLYLQAIQRLRYACGRDSHLFVGARYFVYFLETVGVVAPAASVRPPPPAPELLGAFRHWMRTQRGTTDGTRNGYGLTIVALLQTLGAQPKRYEAQTLRAFVRSRVGEKGIGRAKTVVTAVRMFLRFLVAIGRGTPGLEQALPTIAHWRFSYLPRYLPAESVEQVLASCVLTTAIGVRDRAVLLLLAQWGLRAGDVAAFKWGDIDWHEGTLCVMGKNRRQTRLPLPQAVGEAILDYAEPGRPRTPSASVFLTTVAPIRPSSPKTVTKITADALRRANVDSPIYGAHVLRHSAATHMLRQGASLPTLGAVLRHASVETTAHYAKVDVDLLQEVVRAWPEESLC